MRPLVASETSVHLSVTEWKHLVGSPARVILNDPRTPDGTVKIPGTIREVSTVGVSVELFFPLLAPRTSAPVLLEVMTPNALLQCQTTIQSSTSPQRLHLLFPEEIHPINRRRFQRANVAISASISLTPHRHDATITNLSVGGCAAVLASPLSVGQSVTLDLHATGLAPAQVTAQVVRCALSAGRPGSWEVGLSFYHISEEQRQHLNTYVNLNL